jgi:hypothetical protein
LLPDLTQSLFNILFFSSPDASRLFSDQANDYIAFAHGVLGAVMIGWMVALMSLILGAFGQRSTWNAITFSALTWYVVDTGFSLYSGVVANALFNTVFLVLFAIPLAATYGQFQHRASLSERKVAQDAN